METRIESDGEGNEIWTCGNCGRSQFMQGEGGDVACCPCEFEHEVN